MNMASEKMRQRWCGTCHAAAEISFAQSSLRQATAEEVNFVLAEADAGPQSNGGDGLLDVHELKRALAVWKQYNENFAYIEVR